MDEWNKQMMDDGWMGGWQMFRGKTKIFPCETMHLGLNQGRLTRHTMQTGTQEFRILRINKLAGRLHRPRLRVRRDHFYQTVC